MCNHLQDEVIKRVEQRLAMWVQLPASHQEDMQVSGSAKFFFREMMAHPVPHVRLPHSHPTRGDFFCGVSVNFRTFRGGILAISPRSSRPDLPVLTPETHFCGVRGG
jgi:hypothetical protein